MAICYVKLLKDWWSKFVFFQNTWKKKLNLININRQEINPPKIITKKNSLDFLIKYFRYGKFWLAVQITTDQSFFLTDDATLHMNK
jgi:hypothetical protein